MSKVFFEGCNIEPSDVEVNSKENRTWRRTQEREARSEHLLDKILVLMLGLAFPPSWWVAPHGGPGAAARVIWGRDLPPLHQGASLLNSVNIFALSQFSVLTLQKKPLPGPSAWRYSFLHCYLIGGLLPASLEGSLSDIFLSRYQISGLLLSPCKTSFVFPSCH